ncbi:serine/threonine-protein phosphatase 7 long form-like protein, partial [Trifolium medium]|nr:serine/threonine-protein phosphatase 7 long form-like protein [Trifolium medium]
ERGARKELKMASLGKKLAEWIPNHLPTTISGWLDNLCPLQRISLKMLDPHLITAFVERWHPNTSSFHVMEWNDNYT